jgi:hypothetical protein
VAPTKAGATGVLSNGSNNSLTNNGAIQGATGSTGSAGSNSAGGSGGSGGSGGTGGVGGIGLTLSGGTAANNGAGSISGGAGGTGGNGGTGGAGGHGGAGAVGGHGGVGVALSSLGTLTNAGNIIGGNGGYGGLNGSPSHDSLIAGSGAGGVGVTISGSSLTNEGGGSITGGAGVYGTGAGGAGAAGVTLNGGTLTNNSGASITGGASGGCLAVNGAVGGAGVVVSAGTLTNAGTITGGSGGDGYALIGSVAGGAGGAGVLLNAGMLITSGTISGGAGGTGTTTGAAGDAVQFGSAASTLVVDPGAVFNGHVVANASVNDVLELSGTHAGGTAIQLGTEFTNFSTLTFLPGAVWTVDAGTHAAPSGGLAIDGFTTGDSIDITNLTPTQVEADFNPATDVITTASDGTLTFNGVSGDTFAFTAKGAGTDITLKAGAATTLAAAGHDIMNFVGDEHRAFMGGQFMLGTHGFGSAPMPQPESALAAFSGHGFSAIALTDHGIAHALSVGSHA